MEYVRLEKLVELKQGLAINSHTNYLVSDHETKLALLRIADMPSKRKVVFMDEDTPDRYIADEDDIIYTRTGQVGLVFTGQNGVVHNNCFRVIPIDEQTLSRKYLFWALSLPEVYYMANIYAAGAAQPDLPHSSFKKIKIPICSPKLQGKIVSILSAYDNLIENNNKRIRLLEQMAENLYKEWFVRFRFPGHEKAEFENGLPKSWSIKKLGEFIKFERGVGYGSKDIIDGENVLLSMNNIRPYGGFKRDYSRLYSGKFKEFQKVNEGDLIMSITDMTQDRRIIGYTGIVPPGKDNRIICTHLVKLSSEISHTYFLNGLFNYSNLSRIIAERATGANVLGLTADILKGVKTLLPPTELQSMYVTKVTPIIEECFSLQDANDNLARQRDLLLPRLMSGKLEVNI